MGPNPGPARRLPGNAAALGGGTGDDPAATRARPPARGFALRGITERRNVSTLLIGNRVLLSERLVYSGLGIRTQGRL